MVVEKYVLPFVYIIQDGPGREMIREEKVDMEYRGRVDYTGH